MTVFIVMYRYWDDAAVEMVASTREKAQAYIDGKPESHRSNLRVIEAELDVEIEEG